MRRGAVRYRFGTAGEVDGFAHVSGSQSQSQYKASLARSLLESVDRLDDALRRRVYELAGPEHVRAIRDAPRTSWLEAEHQIAVDGAIAEVLGNAALERMIREYVSRASDTPLFKPLMRGAIALFGLTPASIYRILPRAWGMTSREAGIVSERVIDDRHHEVTYAQLPELMRVESIAVTTRGSLLGMLDLVGHGGTVETDLGQLPDGKIVHRIAWQPRG